MDPFVRPGRGCPSPTARKKSYVFIYFLVLNVFDRGVQCLFQGQQDHGGGCPKFSRGPIANSYETDFIWELLGKGFYQRYWLIIKQPNRQQGNVVFSLIWQWSVLGLNTWYNVSRFFILLNMYTENYNRLLYFPKKKWKSLKIYFSLCDLDMQWTHTIWTIIKEGHIRIVLAKFGQNPTRSLGDVI